MSTENPLATMQDAPTAIACDDAAFKATTSSKSYLSRLQLMTSNSEKCKSGEFPINHWARVADSDHRDLGENVDILIVAWRPLAIENTPEGEFLSCYDPESEEFARIQKIADKPGLNGCMYGPQFLVWVPSQEEFMSMLCGSKTARRASTSVKALMQNAGTLGSQKIEGKDFTWFGMTCQACTTPFEMPSEEECRAVMTEFANPPEPEIEKVKEGEVAGDRE